MKNSFSKTGAKTGDTIPSGVRILPKAKLEVTL